MSQGQIDYLSEEINRLTRERNQLIRERDAALQKLNDVGERMIGLALDDRPISKNGRIEQIARDALVYTHDAREKIAERNEKGRTAWESQ